MGKKQHDPDKERVFVRPITGSYSLTDELKRPHRPSTVQRILQSVFVSEAIEAGRCRVLRGGKHRQHGVPRAVGAIAPSSAEDALTVVPGRLQVAIASADPRRWAHLHDSPVTPATSMMLRDTTIDRSRPP